jgi:hypothetical protein
MPADAVAALMLARRPGMLLTTGERARRARPGHDTSAGRPRLARSPT